MPLRALLLLAFTWPVPASGQAGTAVPLATSAPLTLDAALAAARRGSADLAASRAAALAAHARERQAAAAANPVFSFGTEATSADGQANWQQTAAFEQSVEMAGQRAARRDAARWRREAEEANLAFADSRLRYDVTLAFAKAVASTRRAALSGQAALEFERAVAVSAERLASGDISGYEHRRLRLEAARYAVLGAEAELERTASRRALATLMGVTTGALPALPDSLPELPAIPGDDAPSWVTRAVEAHPEVRAAQFEAEAARADARLVRREAIPSPTLMAGYKREESIGILPTLTGFVAGISVPLPLWDRRAGAREAGDADATRREAELAAVRRRIGRDAADALDAFHVAVAQRARLARELGAEVLVALNAAQLAYAEGEITLVEWLDAVRAYRETEATLATLEAEVLIRRAALERAIGTPIDATPRN